MSEIDRPKLLRDSLKTLATFTQDLVALFSYLFNLEMAFERQVAANPKLDQRLVLERIQSCRALIKVICHNCGKTSHTYLNAHGRIKHYVTLEPHPSGRHSSLDLAINSFVQDLNLALAKVHSCLDKLASCGAEQDKWRQAFRLLDSLVQFMRSSALDRQFDVFFFKSSFPWQHSSYISVLERIDKFLQDRFVFIDEATKYQEAPKLNQNTNNNRQRRLDYDSTRFDTTNLNGTNSSSSDLALKALKLNFSLLSSSLAEFLRYNLRNTDFSRLFDSLFRYLFLKLVDMLVYSVILIIFTYFF